MNYLVYELGRFLVCILELEDIRKTQRIFKKITREHIVDTQCLLKSG